MVQFMHVAEPNPEFNPESQCDPNYNLPTVTLTLSLTLSIVQQ